MRFILLTIFALSLSSCSSWNGVFKKIAAEQTAVIAPSSLEGPAYDPSTSPVPMTSNTVLPSPAGTAQPAAYGNQAQQPQAYGGNSENPDDYPPATAPLGTEAKGGEGPATYGSAPTAYSASAGEAAVLAATLNGLWVNGADNKEVVEFTIDHYTTFYNGEMLFQEAMTYHAACPGDCNGGQVMEVPCFTITGPGGTDCFAILRLTPYVMELSMLGVSTEPIIYTKQ